MAEKGASWSGREPNVLFQNRGDNTFDEVGNVLGLALRLDSRGVSAGDIDGDGDQDLVVYNRNAPLLRIYRNDGIVQGRSALIDVRATDGDPYAIGAQVVLACDGRSMLRQVAAGGGFLSQSPYTLHFGLGACSGIERVTVRWPNGREESWRDLPVGQHITLTQGEAAARTAALRPLNSVGDVAGAARDEASEGVSAPAPDVALDGFDGAPDATVRSLAAGTTVLNFWATWCTACLAEMPDLQALSEAFKPKGVRFIGVVMDERDRSEMVVRFLKDRGVTYGQLWGDVTDQAPFASLASVPTGAIPMTVVLHEGLVRRVVAGAIDPRALTATLDRLLETTATTSASR